MKPRHLKDWQKNELIQEVKRLRERNKALFEQNQKLMGMTGTVTTAEIDAQLRGAGKPDRNDESW